VRPKNDQSPRLPSLTVATRLLRSAARHGRPRALRGAAVRLSYDFLLSLREATEAGTVPSEPVDIVVPGWNRARALKTLRVRQVPFAWERANHFKGYASGRTVAVAPFDQTPHLTLFHELAHVVLGHTRVRPADRTVVEINLLECHAHAVAWLVARALGLSCDRCAGDIGESAQLCPGRDPFAPRYVRDVLRAATRILTAGLGHTDRETDAHKRTVMGVVEMREALGVPRLAAELNIPIAEAHRHFDECDDADIYERICDLGDEAIAERAGLPIWGVEGWMADQYQFSGVNPPSRLTAAVTQFYAERRLGTPTRPERDVWSRVRDAAIEAREVLGVLALAAERRVSIAEAQRRYEADHGGDLFDHVCNLGEAKIADLSGHAASAIDEWIANEGTTPPPARLADVVFSVQRPARGTSAAR
jgi:hypothetical protein